MQNQNHNTNWQTQVNMAGVNSAGGGIKVVEGYYNGVVNAAYIDLSRNADRVVIKVAFSDPAVKGAIRTTSIYLPGKTPSGKDNRMFWRAILESCGYQPAQLEGQVNLSAQALVNRPCTVYFRPKDPNAVAGSDQYDQLTFLSPGHWATKKGLFEASKKNAPAASAATFSAPSLSATPAAPTPSASSAGFAPSNLSTTDLLGMAGLPQNN